MHLINYDCQTLKYTLDLFSSMIRCLEPQAGDIFKAKFADCHFDETTFLSLEGEKSKTEERCEIS